MVLLWHGCCQSLLLELSGTVSWSTFGLPELWLGWWDTVEFGAGILCIWKPWTQAPSFPKRPLIISGGSSSITLMNRTWFPPSLLSNSTSLLFFLLSLPLPRPSYHICYMMLSTLRWNLFFLWCTSFQLPVFVCACVLCTHVPVYVCVYVC